ncbi:MAG: ZIP family metal transporter [candidate division WOR-3 bacterium]
MILLNIIISTIIVSLISLIGIIFLIISKDIFEKLLFFLISLAAGALIGGSLLHLMPHSLEKIEPLSSFWIFILGFVSFFLLERILRWRHCHEFDCPIHPVTYLSLIGDSIHNFIDGVVIASSFLINFHFGIITTLIVLAHELPQELSDYAILIYGGMGKIKALIFNFITGLTSFIGGIAGYFFLRSENLILYILPFVAGNFFYISASDLIPELHNETNLKKSINSFLYFISGILLISFLKLISKNNI